MGFLLLTGWLPLRRELLSSGVNVADLQSWQTNQGENWMKRTLLISAIAAGMLWVASCGTNSTAQLSATAAASSAQSGGTEVDITLADNTIQSSLTTFKVGEPYRFVIINNGNHPHDFNISTPVDKAGSIDAALSTALLTVPQDKLPIGGGTTVV